MAERVREFKGGGPGGPHGPRGPRPRVANPGKVFGRIIGYVFKFYKIPFLVAIACIFVSVLCNV
ncbi:MAG: hypothetical protein ACI4OL_02470, partial [Gemmiger sp.]